MSGEGEGQGENAAYHSKSCQTVRDLYLWAGLWKLLLLWCCASTWAACLCAFSVFTQRWVTVWNVLQQKPNWNLSKDLDPLGGWLMFPWTAPRNCREADAHTLTPRTFPACPVAAIHYQVPAGSDLLANPACIGYGLTVLNPFLLYWPELYTAPKHFPVQNQLHFGFLRSFVCVPKDPVPYWVEHFLFSPSSGTFIHCKSFL